MFDLQPVTEDHEMSLFSIGDIDIVINDTDVDVPSVIAFATDDCDRDYADALAKGAVGKSALSDKSWVYVRRLLRVREPCPSSLSSPWDDLAANRAA